MAKGDAKDSGPKDVSVREELYRETLLSCTKEIVRLLCTIVVRQSDEHLTEFHTRLMKFGVLCGKKFFRYFDTENRNQLSELKKKQFYIIFVHIYHMTWPCSTMHEHR